MTLAAMLPAVAAAGSVGGLRIDDVFLPEASLVLLQAGLPAPARSGDFEAAVIDNRLLADWTQTHLSADVLRGIDGEVEAQVMQLLGAQFPQTAMPAAESVRIDDATLRRVLALSSAQSMFELTGQQRRQAAALIVAQLPAVEGPSLQVTLLEVFERESIQGLAELHALQRDYLQRQAATLLQQRWQRWRWQQDGRFDAAALAGLTRMVRDQQLKQRWLQEQGLIGDFHHESTAAQARWSEVSEAAMKRYYDEHPEVFRQVDQVEADVLLLESQADADESYAELQAGLSFADAVRRDGAPGSGALGTIHNDATASSLLRKVALIQRKGISRPFRIAEQWAIYQVHGRHERLLPFSDESVRHECARAVAKLQAQSQFDELRQRLRGAATVRRISS